MNNSGFEESVESVSKTPGIELLPVGRGSATCRVFKTRIHGKWIFVKELKPQLCHDSRLEAAFLKEMEIGFQLDHPSLPRYVLTKGILPEGRYVAMEYIDGLTLDEFVEKNPRYFADEGNLKRFLREMADVLDYLHSRQVIHLDIKPSNVMITRVGQKVKLIDLGFCTTDSFQDTAGLTQGFTAPERENEGGEKTAAIDYYGIGVLLRCIRENTEAFPEKRFRTLEQALLSAHAAARPSSWAEMEKLMPGKGSVRNRTVGLGLILVALIVILVFINPFERKEEVYPPASASSDTSEVRLPVSASEETADEVEFPQSDEQQTPPLPTPAKEAAVLLPEEKPLPRASSESGRNMEEKAAKTQTLSLRDEQEAFLKELRKSITTSYEPIASRLKKAILEENYSELEYKAINNLLDNTSHTLMKGWIHYKQKYPHLSDDYIQDMTGHEMETAEYRLWKKDWDKYNMEYLRRGKAAGNN